jgi:hypothetical protein
MDREQTACCEGQSWVSSPAQTQPWLPCGSPAEGVVRALAAELPRCRSERPSPTVVCRAPACTCRSPAVVRGAAASQLSWLSLHGRRIRTTATTAKTAKLRPPDRPAGLFLLESSIASHEAHSPQSTVQSLSDVTLGSRASSPRPPRPSRPPRWGSRDDAMAAI